MRRLRHSWTKRPNTWPKRPGRSPASSAFPSHYPVILSGGAFKACPSLSRRLEVLLDEPEMEVRLLEVEPAVGAVTLALKLIQ